MRQTAIVHTFFAFFFGRIAALLALPEEMGTTPTFETKKETFFLKITPTTMNVLTKSMLEAKIVKLRLSSINAISNVGECCTVPYIISALVDLWGLKMHAQSLNLNIYQAWGVLLRWCPHPKNNWGVNCYHMIRTYSTMPYKALLHVILTLKAKTVTQSPLLLIECFSQIIRISLNEWM